MGIALLPEYYARKIRPDTFAAVPLADPEIRWPLVMAWKKHQRPTHAFPARQQMSAPRKSETACVACATHPT